MKVHLLLTPEIAKTRPDTAIIVMDFGQLTVRFENKNGGDAKFLTGLHCVIEDTKQNFAKWLSQHDGIPVGNGSPMSEIFNICHINNIYTNDDSFISNTGDANFRISGDGEEPNVYPIHNQDSPPSKEKLILTCVCSSEEHQLEFEIDPEFDFVNCKIKLVENLGFKHRFYIGIRYIFGVSLDTSSYDEILLGVEHLPQIERLYNTLKNFKPNKK